MKIYIAERIRSMRKQHNMMQEQLAEALGVSIAAVSKWERGAAIPELGYIAEMADLFGVSLDVLVGYQVQKGTAADLEKRIEELRKRKEFEEAAVEAEKALVRYPNNFAIVYCCGEMYLLKGIDTHDVPSVERAIELLSHAILLLPQNMNPEINEYTIQTAIAQCYLFLGKEEQGLELLKKCNLYGIHDALIGMTYAVNECYKAEEAEEYLMKAFTNSLTMLVRTMMGYINYYNRKASHRVALEVTLWLIEYLESIKQNRDDIAYVDKMIGPLYAECATISEKLGNPKEAEQYLIKAFEIAAGFDETPVYSVQNIKFCIGDTSSITIYDDIGTTVMSAVEKHLEKSEENKRLQLLWEKMKSE